MPTYLVVNADDFGASSGINRGIIDAHTHGIVTSTSMIVTGRAVYEAVMLSRAYPALAIGLHWDVFGEDERTFDTDDLGAVRDEFDRQLDFFHRLFGRLPTHLDSHRHAHRTPELLPIFSEWAATLGVPLRFGGGIRHVSHFYAQWKWQLTELEKISVPTLQELLRTEVHEGWTEFGCHPGYRSSDYQSIYLDEREVELATLTDPRVRETIAAEGITLASFADYARQQ